jgi:hypothetical protein
MHVPDQSTHVRLDQSTNTCTDTKTDSVTQYGSHHNSHAISIAFLECSTVDIVSTIQCSY